MSTEQTPADKPADTLGRAVTLKAHIDQSGLTVGGKSRALAAIDRLIGGMVGWAAEFFEGKRTETQAKAEAREALIRADAAEAVKHLKGMSEVGQGTLQRFLRDEYRKQDNRISVAIHAQEQLLALQPPAIPKSDTAPKSQDPDPPELDADWINIFSSYAEHASSERLRELWGRILAGEVRRPGSFAPTTLRVIAEMDAEIARDFQEVYRLSVNGWGVRPEPFEGSAMDKFASLEQAGLAHTDLNRVGKISGENDDFRYFIGEQFLLRITPLPNHPQISFPAIQITRVGRQIGTILPRDEIDGLRHIGHSLTDAKKVELCELKERKGTTYNFQIIEVLYDKE